MTKLLYKFINQFSAFILGIIVGFMLHAEVVEAKPISLHKQSKVEGFTGNVDASYVRSAGNFEKNDISGNAYTQYLKKNDHVCALAVEGEYKERSYETTESRLAHARFRKFYSSYLGLETFLHHEVNSQKNLTSSYVLAAGPYLRAFNSPYLLLDVGTLLAAEQEEYKVDDDEYALRNYHYASASFRLPYQILLGHTVQYEPEFANESDYRLYNISTFQVKATKYVSVGFNLDQMYDSEPASNTSSDDFKLKATVGVEW